MMSAKKNVFSNPIIKDVIEIIEDTKDRLVFKTYLQPFGGQNTMHYHSKLTETFKIIEGELVVFLNNKKIILKQGDCAIIKPFDVHQFINASNKKVIFKVEIHPAKQIKQGLQIIYGLANNGKTFKSGLPKNIFYTAISLNMMDAFVPTAPLCIQKAGITFLATLGKCLGLEKKLLNTFSNFSD